MEISFSLVFFVLAFIIDIAVMMWNFDAKKEEQYGKYKAVYCIVKTFLLPFLMGIYVFAAENIDHRMIKYLVAAWIGDTILLIPGYLATIIGGIFFALGHWTMVRMFGVDWKQVPQIAYFFMLPGLCLHYGYLMPKMSFKTYHGYCVLVYCTILELSTCNAAARLSYLPLSSPSFWLSYVGYLNFILSDYFLITVSLHLDKKLRRKEILGTYIVAQACLVLSFLI